MTQYENLVGNQEDWAQYITNVEMRDTVFLDWLPLDSKPTNVIYSYQADAYAAAGQNSHVDGQPWTFTGNPGDQRGRLRALIQWFDKTTSISRLSQDVSNTAGVNDELARDITKKLKEMATDMEANYLEDWDCREDDHQLGYLSRAVGSWVSSSAQALYPVPAAFLTPAASISSTGSGSAVENTMRDLLQSINLTCKSRETITGFVGFGLKRMFSDFQFFIPSSSSAVQSANTFSMQTKDKTLIRSVDRYEGDGAPLELVLNYWLANVNGTAAMQKFRGYFLHQSKWAMRWNSKPKVYRPEFKGGSYEAAMDCIAMLVCKNPQGEGKYAPTS
jgi:hypothetical protein